MAAQALLGWDVGGQGEMGAGECGGRVCHSSQTLLLLTHTHRPHNLSIGISG